VAALERVVDRFFAGILRPAVVYGRHGRPRGENQVGILLGQYDSTKLTITLHPILADMRVPRWVLDWVVFHELLHMTHGDAHGPIFEAAEAEHPHTRRMERWTQRHLFRIYCEE